MGVLGFRKTRYLLVVSRRRIEIGRRDLAFSEER